MNEKTISIFKRFLSDEQSFSKEKETVRCHVLCLPVGFFLTSEKKVLLYFEFFS
jgi:hypothetical protein